MIISEDFLSYLWRFQWFNQQALQTVKGELIEVLNPGTLNNNAGPDFLNAKIRIQNQIWVGNVEIHQQSTDWLKHNHQKDSAYNNVILHVVYSHNQEVLDLQNKGVPTLELESLIPTKIYKKYTHWINAKPNTIPCQNEFKNVNELVKGSWLTHLLIERLQIKSLQIEEKLKKDKDWEKILFVELAKGFGLKINSISMEIWAKNMNFKLVRQYHKKPLILDALFFGVAGFLQSNHESNYFQTLKNEFDFLKRKHQLEAIDNSIFKFFRLRPTNFPTIRLAQLSAIYAKHQNLFTKVIGAKTVKDLEPIFLDLHLNPFWNNHYHFKKTAKKNQVKSISKAKIQNLAINVIIPLQFTYAKHIGKQNEEDLLLFYESLTPEKNKIVALYHELGARINHAADSQAYLQLNRAYCNPKKCLHCRIGHQILGYERRTT